MAIMDVTAELKLTEIRKQNLRKTFDHIESQSSSVLFLALQWKDIEEQFDSIAKSISQRHKKVTSLEESIIKRFDEIQLREQGFESVQESVNSRFKELKLREKNFEEKERLEFEEQSKELNLLRVSVEKQSREVEMVQRMVEEEIKALEMKEKRFVILQKSVEEESKKVEVVQNSIKGSFRELELKEIQIEDRVKEIDLRERRIEVHSKELELKEKQLEEHAEVYSKELELKEKQLEELGKEHEMKEKRFEKNEKAFDLKERIWEERFEERAKEVELKKKRFEELEKAFDLKEKRLEERAVEIELEGKMFEELANEVELKEKRFEKLEKAFDLKERIWEERFEERANKMELKEKRLEELEKAFDLKEKRLEERTVEIELEGKMFEELANEVELKEKRFEKLEKAFDLKERIWEERFEERANKMELKEKRFEELEKAFDLKERIREEQFEERVKEVDLKEKRFEEHEIAFALKEKRLEEHCVEIELKGKVLEERANEVELKEKIFEKRSEAFDLNEKGLEECDIEIDLNEKGLEECDVEIDSNDKGLEECDVKIDSNEKGLEECDIEIDSKEKELEECDTEIDSKEKGLEEYDTEIELKEKRLEDCWATPFLFPSERKRLEEGERLRLEERYREIELKGRLLEQCSKEVELKEKKLEQCSKEIELKEEKEFEQCSLDIEAKDKGFAENFNTEVQSKALEKLAGDDAIEVCAPKHAQLCEIMDGKSLQMFLNKHWVDHDEVSYALRKSSDPAKLVLDAMQGFYPLNADNGNTCIDSSVVRKSCILLLEQLMRMSPEITPTVKGEAMKLAFDWMTKMRLKDEDRMEFLGFLLLLAAYGLASAFDEDELVSQLVVVARDRLAPKLCRVLGLVDKISDFIRNLITRKQHLDAIRLVYAFDLVGAFEPVRLLTHYLKVSKQAARKICRMQNDSPASQIEALNKRVADAKALIRCIKDHNLESKFPPKRLECSIAELDKKKANIIRTFPSSVPKPQPQQHCEKTCIIAAPHVPPLTTAPTSEPTPNVEEGQENENKRLRTALSATDAFNASLGATSSIYSVPFPNQKPSGFYTDQEIKQTTLENPQKNNTKRESCNLPLKPHSREAAMKFAADLKVKLDKKIEKRDNVMQFLELLATYELTSSFDPDELLGLFKYVYLRKKAPVVWQALGLADKIPKFIQNLVEKEERIEAVRYVCAFGLHDKFPPVTLLKDYLSHSKKVADKILEDGKNSLEAQICSIRKEIAAYKCVLLQIANFKLESEYPPKILEDRIVQLEKHRENMLKVVTKRKKDMKVLNSKGRGGPVTRSKSKVMKSQSEKKETASTTGTPAAPAAQPLQLSGRKRRRVSESPKAAHPNLHSNHGVQYSTRHYSSAGFPHSNQLTCSYPNIPFSYYPGVGYYHGVPAAPYGGPCNTVNGPGYNDRPSSSGGHGDGRGPSYRDGQAHYGSYGLPPQRHSSLNP